VKRPTEVLDFKSFVKGSHVITNQVEINRYLKKKAMYKTVIRVGLLSITILTALPISHHMAYAATTLAEAAHETQGNTWDRLVAGLVKLLDPAAKVFGIIAGIAIMTGNGKIGLERLFWLSLGYITARKVGAWIEFLNGL
jgi:hypothetical protein